MSETADQSSVLGEEWTLLQRGGIATALAVVGNALVVVVGAIVFDVPPDFEPLKPAPVLLSSAIGAVGATGVYAGLHRLTDASTRLFNIVAALVLGLSFILVFLFAIDLPAATVSNLSIVAVTHTVVAAACVGVIPEY